MLKGYLKVIDKEQMDKLHGGILEVLQRTGLQIQGRFLLEALADAGCKVDFANHRVWFKPELVEKQIASQRGRNKMVRSSLWYPFCRELPEGDAAWPDEFTVDYGFGAPWIYDCSTGDYRKPVTEDQIDMIKLGNALDCVGAVNSPFICSDFDSRIETIESSRLLLLHTDKPGWVGTSCGKEVKYLAEFAALALDNDKAKLETQPPFFIAAYCTTSPLKLDTRSCEVLEEALKYKFPVNFAPMPILGATTPMTPAGSAIIAGAEILGCMTATTLIDSDVCYYSTSISGEMDMSTTQICYSSPAAILTDAALHQLFREKYGIVHNVEAGYVEAKAPGIQASFMKTYRQMAFGSTVSSSLPIGMLDNGSCFSPTQAMIDIETNEAMYKFGKGMEVNDDTMCVDLINEMEFCAHRTYLESEHTLKHFRDIGWNTNLFDRRYRQDQDGDAVAGDEDILRKADKRWRELVAGQGLRELDSKFKAEIEQITAAARKELLV